MKAFYELPKEYQIYKTIDLNKKKYLILFNLFVILVSLIIFSTFKINSCPLFSIRSFIVLAIGIYLSIIIHELIHGIFIWLFSKKRAKYKISFFYASAGAKDRYFDKYSYIIIAIAPLIILSFLLFILLYSLPLEYYNSILLILALSASGSIGDIYMTIITLLCPDNILINDSGEIMHFYKKT
ncbi:MAG: DUF3267 domain-containing protein [Pleomorphochaeta sp.]